MVLFAHGEEELGDVVGVECARLRWESTWEVGVADVDYIVVDVQFTYESEGTYILKKFKSYLI